MILRQDIESAALANPHEQMNKWTLPNLSSLCCVVGKKKDKIKGHEGEENILTFYQDSTIAPVFTHLMVCVQGL